MAKAKSKLVEEVVEKPAVKLTPIEKEVVETAETEKPYEGYHSRDFRSVKK